MKKKYLFLLSALLVVVLSTGFTACSDHFLAKKVGTIQRMK